MNLEIYYFLKQELKKDELLYGHCFRVSELACKIAKKLNFSKKDIKNIEIGAMLHDIGKLLVPKEILYKEDKLTDEEFKEIKKHPQYGINLLKGEYCGEVATDLDNNQDLNSEVLDMILYHHRFYDGCGYPKEGNNNSHHLTQIITICDCFDAMCDNKRTYKKSLTIDEAISELKKNSGTQFNPVYVNTLISILRD